MSEEHSYYNLIVVGGYGAWEKGSCSFPLSRYVEYTKDEVKKKLNLEILESIYDLSKYPAIFAYESDNAFIGKITSISVKKGEIQIEYQIYNKDNPLNFISLSNYDTLEIHDFEVNRTHWAVKRVNLLNILSNEGYDVSSYESIPSNINKVAVKKQSELKSLSDFIRKLLSTNKNSEYEVYYRGHSKDNYMLIPGIFRKDKNENYVDYNNEELIYKELIVSNSHDFREDTCTFDKLVRMQHYSLPTRLLDITSNPLVSLFFACNTNSNADGKIFTIYVKKDSIKYYDSDSVSCVSNLALLRQEYKENIFSVVNSYIGATNQEDRKKYEDEFNNHPDVLRLYHFIKAEKPFFQKEIHLNEL